ncbi:MAG: Nif3-like dinuclear metal center hexameric protein [Syntrophomonadaceae bacterium]|nr:Nif3-like dinuclear metal center hexameric protein [Syntrophomonadaceae bacterium]
MVRAEEVTKCIEQLAPLSLAEAWDNVGWQVGDPAAPVKRVLIGLGYSPAVLQEALLQKADLIITHHPFIFQPLRQLRYDRYPGSWLRELVQEGIMLYAAHTNLDNASVGISQALGERLGLQQLQVFGSKQAEKLFKLVVFVPQGHEDEVRQAVSEAGAGWIGNYSHCTFQLLGTGTFLPREGTSPFIGQSGRLEKVAEYRLETIISEAKLSPVLHAMRETHPYEEVAYDLYPLQQTGRQFGPGRIGLLPGPHRLVELVERVKQGLRVPVVRVHGDLDQYVEKVAVCGGSGAFLVASAVAQGAQVLITGDVKYHEAQEAVNHGLAIIDAGHAATEFPGVEFLAAYLQEKLPGVQFSVFPLTLENTL